MIGQGRPIAVRNLLFPKVSGAHLDSKISAIVLKFSADSVLYPKQGGSAGNLIIEDVRSYLFVTRKYKKVK